MKTHFSLEKTVHLVAHLSTVCVSVVHTLTHAVVLNQGGSENGSQLLGVSCEDHLTRLWLDEAFVQRNQISMMINK